MAETLVKGGNVSLTKIAPSVDVLKIVMCWQTQPKAKAGSEVLDINACCLMLTSSGKVRDDNDFVFYNNRTSSDGALKYLGRNVGLKTAEDIDAEAITVDLKKLSPEVVKLIFAVSIYQAQERKQSFAQVSNSLICVADNKSNGVMAAFGMNEDDLAAYQSVIFGEVYRYKNEWKFRAVGSGFYGGLEVMLSKFGVQIG